MKFKIGEIVKIGHLRALITSKENISEVYLVTLYNSDYKAHTDDIPYLKSELTKLNEQEQNMIRTNILLES